jgi:hypothetical protein
MPPSTFIIRIEKIRQAGNQHETFYPESGDIFHRKVDHF